MDIRGIEVTNQLRSAIRAKLLELGVRYDEELPDYILVMVVNKKSRQQMHEDLHLFLEKCTTPFVDWLHDQVLKKLQKVTVAKKKTLREFVPMVVVKQEEEKKKRKTSTTSFLEDQAANLGSDKSSNKNAKDDKNPHKQTVKLSVPSQKLDTSQNKSLEKTAKNVSYDSKPESDIIQTDSQQATIKKLVQTETPSENVIEEVTQPERSLSKIDDSPTNTKSNDVASRALKRPLDGPSTFRENAEKKQTEAKRIKIGMDEDDEEDNAKKLKSCVNKPKITSVVSVKHRLGVVSSRKKFEVHREKVEAESRYRPNEKRFEKNRFGGFRNNNFQRGRTFDVEDRSRRTRESELKYNESEKMNDIKNRLGSVKNEKPKNPELKEKTVSTLKPKSTEKLKGTIKDRLGITNTNRSEKQSRSKSQEYMNLKIVKSLEQDALANNKTIKNRLGPMQNIFRPQSANNVFNSTATHSQSTKHDATLRISAAEKLDNEAQSPTNTGSIKSHIIAVNKVSLAKTERKRLKPLKKASKELSSDVEEDLEDTKIPSKVIVTPRPLKPLQPTQKRATQSLLLRAVAEANQSVVTQKNPEPSVLDKKPVLKHLRLSTGRDVGQNLSVHFNSNKRLVMEKIQVELNTDVLDTKKNAYVTQPVTEEHMGVVMSLFQRSDDNQKFLVTLNGYNNNFTKEKTLSDDEERLEMEVNADDEVALLVTQNDTYVTNESESTVFRITDLEDDDVDMSAKERTEENNENCNIENVEKTEEVPRKRRKLSPIVYNRSHSPSPAELKTIALLTNSILTKNADKKPETESAPSVVDKSREKCRYWPNCTSGSKCAYMHPPVVCSAFPACKFRHKCAYKHPKCKFGLSCTKLGCVFSHPAQQCKYHPFCTKPGCPYGHPTPHSTVAVETTTQRAKFTWRRRD